jgi:hypothetical protein
MMNRKPAEQPIAPGGSRNKHFPAVLFAAMPQHQSGSLHPVHQFHCAVVLQLHTLRQLAHRRTLFRREAFDGQKQLVLLRFNARPTRSLFAKMEKTPDLIPEFRQRTIVELVRVDHGLYRITTYLMTAVPSELRGLCFLKLFCGKPSHL